MTASKNGKVTTTKNGVNIDLANLALASKLQGTLNLAGEFEVYLELDRLNAEGLLSVRGIRATLEEVEKVGSAPSMRSDYAQQFPLVREMRKLKGAEGKTLKELFNLAVQGRKAFGTEGMADTVAGSKTLAGLSKAVKVEKDKKAEESETRGAGKETADEKKAGKSAKGEQSAEDVAKALTALIKKGEAHLTLATANALWEALSDLIPDA